MLELNVHRNKIKYICTHGIILYYFPNPHIHQHFTCLLWSKYDCPPKWSGRLILYTLKVSDLVTKKYSYTDPWLDNFSRLVNLQEKHKKNSTKLIFRCSANSTLRLSKHCSRMRKLYYINHHVDRASKRVITGGL